MIARSLCVSLLLALTLPAAAKDLQVGIYVGPGSSEEDRALLAEVLLGEEGFEVWDVTAEGLDGLDVLVVGAGGGTALGEGLGPEGGAALEAFVARGGGYVGLGAGAYLGARGYNDATRNLELVDACLVDRPGWQVRGEGWVELAPVAGQPLGELSGSWYFAKGPLFAPARGLGRRPYVACATFITDLNAEDPEQAGIMPGTDAIVCAGKGKGRAVLASVLPQHGEETASWLPRAVRWAAGAGELPRTAEPPREGIAVAILDDAGCIGGCVLETFVCLDDQEAHGFWARRVNAREVRAGALKGFEVVMLPGGSATKQSRGLGPEGQEQVRRFVRRGGGYVGVCAGAYLAAAEPTRYGLGLASVRCADTKHWRRGGGQPVLLESLPAFAELTGREEARHEIFYMNGPLLEAMEVDGLPPVVPLLRFLSDIHEGDAPAGVMPGKIAGLRTTFGKGRVVCFSPHPELTGGYEDTMVQAVLWAAGRKQLEGE